MTARLAADALLLLHLAFVVFALFGGLLVAWRAWFAALHLPTAAWAAWIEASGGICPLTPWENRLRQRAGDSGYEGGFVEHYLIPVLYPAGLTPALQQRLALVVVAVNLAIYLTVFAVQLRRRRTQRGRQQR